MSANNELWTVGRILKWTENYFKEKGVETPRLDAEVLLAKVLKRERIYLYVHFDEPLQQDELAGFREMIKKRVAHMPVAYILGEKEFMGLKFKVTPATLIPRPDTEILVQRAVELLRGKMADDSEVRFADIGTGSGAICLSVLNFVPNTVADTVDISATARKVAEKNAAALDLTERIQFFTGDLLKPIASRSYDAILSNPPYIKEADIKSLAPEVATQEPMTALAGGKDGLDFYRRLCLEAPAMLKAGGFMAFEVGQGQAGKVAALAVANALIAKTEIIKDYAGIERVVIAWKK